jgi:hypothetical protein
MILNILDRCIFENSWLKICFFKKKIISLQKDRFNLKTLFITFLFSCLGGNRYIPSSPFIFFKLL